MTTSGHVVSPSPWRTLTTGMSNPSLPLALTAPTKKKSHARKQPPGHIPRPRNAFILFRCDFVRQRKLPPAVENDHRNISRIVGRIWREMPHEEKRPWLDLAELEKETHAVLYPGYKYSPGGSAGRIARRQKNKGDGFGAGTGTGKTDQKDKDTSPTMPFHRRSSSCPPPGAIPITPAASIPYDPIRFTLTTRDDLASGRRPSITTIYHSASTAAQAVRPSMGAYPGALEDRADNAVPVPMLNSAWMASQLGPPLMASSYGMVAQPAGSPWGWGDSLQPYQWPTAAPAPDFNSNGRKHDVGSKVQTTATATADNGDPGLDFSSFDWARYITEMPPFTNPFQTKGPQSATLSLSLHQGIPPTHGPQGYSAIDKRPPNGGTPPSAADADLAHEGRLFAGGFGSRFDLGPVFMPGMENGTCLNVKSLRGGEVEAELGCAFPRLSLEDSQ